MDYNWCHNPDCHKIETQSRIRGTGNNKVLRTVKIALNSEWIRNSIYSFHLTYVSISFHTNRTWSSS